VTFPGAAVAYFVVLWHRKNGWHKQFPLKFIIIVLVAIVALLSAFYSIGTFVGRSTANFDPLYYITFYTGGNILLMDLYLRDPLPQSEIWGMETFVHPINSLGRMLNITEWQYSPAREFRTSSTGVNVGNVYPIFRSFLADFGFIGFVFMTIITAVILTGIYKAVKNKKTTDLLSMDFITLFYGMMFSDMMRYALNPGIMRNFFDIRRMLTLAFYILLFEHLRFSYHSATRQTLSRSKHSKPKLRDRQLQLRNNQYITQQKIQKDYY
jgi:oligosaccharide repeat unit polymerase